MSKLVYLYELDSVRKSKKEIEAGQKALFEEIACNGNSVVLTFNQLTDSFVFHEILKQENKEMFQIIMNLFQIGVLKISPYTSKEKENHTASQYIQGVMEDVASGKRNFIFSALPVTIRRKENLQQNVIKLDDLSRMLYEAIRYGDIKKLEEWKSGNKEEDEKIPVLVRFVQLVHLLSTTNCARNNIKEISSKNFIYFIDLVLVNGKNECSSLTEAIKNLEQIKEKIPRDKQNSRSNWYDELEKSFKKEPSEDLEKEIVDLCYNFSVEESISSVSKHYNSNDKSDFWIDFQKRLKKRMNELQEYKKTTTDMNIEMPPWESINWMMQELEKREKSCRANYKSEIYEYKMKQNLRKWKQQTKKWLGRYLLVAFVYIIIFIIVNYTFNMLSELFNKLVKPLVDVLGVSFNKPVQVIVVVLSLAISIIIFGLISSKINKSFKVPDIIDNLRSIRQAIKGGWEIKRFKRGNAYNSLNEVNK